MGITVDNFFENVYNVIFSPKTFFDKEDMNISVRLATATVGLIAILNKLASGILNGEIYNATFIFSIIWSIISTIIIWFLTALFFEYIAKIFYKDGRLKKLLYLTAFVPIPYIFFAPLNILKEMGEIGYIFATLAEVLLYFWIIYLYAHALRVTYKITISRAFMLISVPFITIFFTVHWTVGFFSKLWYIFSI